MSTERMASDFTPLVPLRRFSLVAFAGITSNVIEFQPVIGDALDADLVFVGICLPQNRVVRPAIKLNHNAMTGFNFNSTRRFHKLPVHAHWFALIETVELAGKPAILTICQHRQPCIQIHAQTNFARQAVLMFNPANRTGTSSQLKSSKWLSRSTQTVSIRKKSDRSAANPVAETIAQNGVTDGRHVSPTALWI